jgi:hypothetical protein
MFLILAALALGAAVITMLAGFINLSYIQTFGSADYSFILLCLVFVIAAIGSIKKK